MRKTDLDPLTPTERVRLLTALIDERTFEISELSEWRREAILDLAGEGLSYAEIGRVAGLSRDRVSRIVHGN